MTSTDDNWRNDFLAAMGAEFCSQLSPPVPSDEIDPHECCEVIWEVLGDDVTPTDLASLSELQTAALARQFGDYFECDSPTVAQVKDAIERTLFRWPAGSLGEPPNNSFKPNPLRGSA
jgi:hypothetical protein